MGSKTRFLTIIMLILLLASAQERRLHAATRAQNTPPELHLMERYIGSLDADTPVQDWLFSAGEMQATVMVETLSGTLDPALDLLNLNGDSIASNNDFAPTFGTAARLSIPAGESYILRVSTVFGEGEYQIVALPGNMQREWDENFDTPNSGWMRFSRAVENGAQLETPIGETRLFIPDGAPRLRDLYTQMTFTWGDVRNTEAGLMLRGRLESNGQISGYRLEMTPGGGWFLMWNDISGADSILERGTLPQNGESITIGLLAQGEEVAFFANGARLGVVRDAQQSAFDNWGLVIYDGQITVQDFWLATPVRNLPAYPTQLMNWDSSTPADIVSELAALELIPPGGERDFIIPTVSYTVRGGEQRNFLLTDPDTRYDDLVMGGDIRIIDGDDVDCGLVTKFHNAENRLLTFVDTHSGAGILWWQDGELRLNNYFMTESLTPDTSRVLVIVQGQYVTLYVNGILGAQAIVPRRVGNVGVGFVNYADGIATCAFNNVWLWK